MRDVPTSRPKEICSVQITSLTAFVSPHDGPPWRKKRDVPSVIWSCSELVRGASGCGSIRHLSLTLFELANPALRPFGGGGVRRMFKEPLYSYRSVDEDVARVEFLFTRFAGFCLSRSSPARMLSDIPGRVKFQRSESCPSGRYGDR